MEGSSEERLCEEKSRNPEVRRSTIINPFLHELESLNEVIDPASKRFQRWIRYLVPDLWDFVVKQAIEHNLQILAHYHKSINCFINICEGGGDCAEEFIKS